MKSCEWVHTDISYKRYTVLSVVKFECPHYLNQVVEEHDDSIKFYIGVVSLNGRTTVYRMQSKEVQDKIYNELKKEHCI